MLLLALCGAALACGKNGAGRADSGVDAGPLSDGGPSDGGLLPDGGLPDAGPPEVKVRAIFPGHGPGAGGGNALVFGQGFVEGFATRGGGTVSAQTKVHIGAALATEVDVIDDNRLQLTLPAGPAGPADVAVQNPNGSGTCTGCYRYQATLAATSIDPALGPAAGGTFVTVHGQGFAPGAQLSVGGAALLQMVLVNDSTATGLTPPGLAGGADVRVSTHDGTAELRRGFVYADSLAVNSISPTIVSSAGGAGLTVSGAGFSAAAQVLLAGAAQETRWVDAHTLALVSPAHPPGAVEVAVVDPFALPPEGSSAPPPARAQLARGLVFADLSAGAPGTLSLEALSPRRGPLAGGACPAACLHLFGNGLSLPDLQIQVGGTLLEPGALHLLDDHALDVDLPVGAAPGAVEVSASSVSQARTARIPASDPGAFHYEARLAIAAVAPAELPASAAPATAITVSGAGFDQSPGAPLQLRVGALFASSIAVAAGGATLTAQAPAGAPGLADLTVIATDADGFRHSATLPAAVRFTAPLQLLLVDPAQGAQAGGTRVTLRGQGFAPGLTASFGGRLATEMAVRSAIEASCLTPPGEVGAVQVSALQGGETDQVAEAFSYFDPQSNGGGLSGGPLLGSLNVTVIDRTPFIDGNLADARIIVEFAGGALVEKLTDARGQVTFADERLVLPVQVTATKRLYNTITVGQVATANLTVFLRGPAPPPPPPPDPPPPPPPPPQKAIVGGHVFGFKPPPALVLKPTQHFAAYLRISNGSIFSAPPFSPLFKPIVLLHDGDSYSYSTTRLSPTTLYAVFGVEEQQGPITAFAPLLLGVRRDIQPNPAKPLTDADIILDTHLDTTVRATFLDPPQAGAGPLGHQAGVDLDLGTSGILPLTSVIAGAVDHLDFPLLPAASGQGFVFIDQVTSASAVSTYLRRVFGDLSQGMVLGPYLPFPLVAEPAQKGSFAGALGWTLSPGLSPNLIQVQLDGPGLNWSVVLPGDTRRLVVPAAVRSQMQPGDFSWTVEASLAPGFDYGHWNYNDLFGGSWTAYSFDFGKFTVAP